LLAGRNNDEIFEGSDGDGLQYEDGFISKTLVRFFDSGFVDSVL